MFPVLRSGKKKVVRLDFFLIAYLLQDRRRWEPMFFLQDSFGEVLSQTREVVLPYVGKVLTVVHAGGLIPGHESFDEPDQECQIEVWLPTLCLIIHFEFIQ